MIEHRSRIACFKAPSECFFSAVRTCLLYLTASLIALASPYANAQTVYTVSVQDIDYYPIYRTAPGEDRYDGYLRDVLDAFGHEHGIRFEYRPRPIRRGAAEFLGGEYDFILPAHPQWNRVAKAGKRIYYSRPLVYFEDAVLVQRERRNIDASQMRHYGTIHGFTPWKFAQEIDAGTLKVETARTPENLIRMALKGRVDAINLALPVARYYLKQMDAQGKLVSADQLIDIERSRYHLATMNHPDVIDALNRFLAKPARALTQVIESYEKYGLVGPISGDWASGGQRHELASPRAKETPDAE